MVQCPVMTALKHAERSCGRVCPGSCQVARGDFDVKDHWKCELPVGQMSRHYDPASLNCLQLSINSSIWPLAHWAGLLVGQESSSRLCLNMFSPPELFWGAICSLVVILHLVTRASIPSRPVCLGESAPNCSSQKHPSDSASRRFDWLLLAY